MIDEKAISECAAFVLQELLKQEEDGQVQRIEEIKKPFGKGLTFDCAFSAVEKNEDNSGNENSASREQAVKQSLSEAL